MTSPNAVRWSGIAAIVAAVLLPFGALAPLLPDPALALTVTIGNVGLVFLIFTFMGIGRVLADEVGMPGLIFVMIGTVGAVLMIADGVVAAYVYPVVSQPSMNELQGSLGLALVAGLGPLALLVAALVLALTVRRVPALPGRAAWIMLIGALLGLLAGLFASPTTANLLALLVSLIFAAGLAWMGIGLLPYSSGQMDQE